MAEFTIAFDQDKNSVEISKADKEKQYYCVNCGQPMIPVQGPQREWHYRHKEDTTHCNHDEWLHKNLVQLLYDKLSSGDLLNIECPNNKFIENKNISIEKEKQYNDFRPDILLKNEDEDVFFLEVCVSHPCTEDKVKSGIKIIEIRSQDDKVIDEIKFAREIVKNGNLYSIEYYNFLDYSKVPVSVCMQKSHISYFVLHKDKTFDVFRKEKDICVSNSDILLIGVDVNPGFTENIGKAYAYKAGLLNKTELSKFESSIDLSAVTRYLNMEVIKIREL